MTEKNPTQNYDDYYCFHDSFSLKQANA